MVLAIESGEPTQLVEAWEMCDAGNTRVIVANHVLSGEAVARFRYEWRGTRRSIPALSWGGHGLTRKQHAGNLLGRQTNFLVYPCHRRLTRFVSGQSPAVGLVDSNLRP